MMTEFSNQQIVSLLGNHTLWSKKACREILDRKDEFVPLLLEVLDRFISEKDPDNLSDPDLLVPSSMLLAQMRVTEAYPRFISLLSHDDEYINLVWNDWHVEIGPSLLRDTYNGNSALLPALIEARSVSPWVRMMALDAYGTHYQDGHISREETVAFLRRLAYDVYNGKANDDSLVLTGICSCVMNSQLTELIDDVKALYARNVINEQLFGDFESWMEFFNTPKYKDEFHHVDVIADLEKYTWFTERDDDIGNPHKNKKVGRNEPCPCGSGKKYKHCHGR